MKKVEVTKGALRVTPVMNKSTQSIIQVSLITITLVFIIMGAIFTVVALRISNYQEKVKQSETTYWMRATKQVGEPTEIITTHRYEREE